MYVEVQTTYLFEKPPLPTYLNDVGDQIISQLDSSLKYTPLQRSDTRRGIEGPFLTMRLLWSNAPLLGSTFD